MAKVINLVESYVGKAGTSLFASLLMEFLSDPRYKQCEPILVDLDKINPDVATRYRSTCMVEDRISLNPTDNKRTSSIDYLLSLAYENDTEVVVNVPSGAFDLIQDFIQENELPPVILRRWFVSNLDDRSWDIFKSITYSFEDKFRLILVHNLVDGLMMSADQEVDCGITTEIDDIDDIDDDASVDNTAIKIIRLSSLQLSDKDLSILAAKPNLPLSQVVGLLSERGKKAATVHFGRVFEQMYPIILGE